MQDGVANRNNVSIFVRSQRICVYNKDWHPRINEILSAIHEQNNVYDRYAIATQKRLPGRLVPSTIGHLPKEISRFTRFIIHYGATVTIRVISINHRRHDQLL